MSFPSAAVAVCQDWCLTHPASWKKKCKWPEKCAGCPECSGRYLLSKAHRQRSHGIGIFTCADQTIQFCDNLSLLLNIPANIDAKTAALATSAPRKATNGGGRM